MNQWWTLIPTSRVSSSIFAPASWWSCEAGAPPPRGPPWSVCTGYSESFATGLQPCWRAHYGFLCSTHWFHFLVLNSGVCSVSLQSVHSATGGQRPSWRVPPSVLKTVRLRPRVCRLCAISPPKRPSRFHRGLFWYSLENSIEDHIVLSLLGILQLGSVCYEFKWKSFVSLTFILWIPPADYNKTSFQE